MYRVLLLVLFLNVLLYNPVLASVKETKRQIEETKKLIQQKKEQQKIYITYQKDIQTELKKIEQKLRQVDIEIKKIKSEIEKTKTEILSLERSLSVLISDKEFYERLLELLLRKYVEKFVLVDNFYEESFLRTVNYEIIKNFTSELLNVRQNVITVSKIKHECEQKQKKLNEYHAKLVQKQNEQKLLFTQKTELLNKYKRKQKDVEQEIARLLKTQQELEKVLKKLQKEQQKKKVTSVMVTIDRKFPRPINGEIVEKFGKKQVAKDGTCVIRNGVLIQGMSDVNVMCVDHGKVLFVADNFRSYGKIIIVEHKDNIHTIYGQLGDIFINEGDNVIKGQIIGRTNSAGQLYFELRKDFIPVDPELYFE